MRIVVTGGAGFLGSHFVRLALSEGASVTNLDLLTYAGDLARLPDVAEEPGYSFVKADVARPDLPNEPLLHEPVDAVVHFAADTHVTRSETDPKRFFRTNVEGTKGILELALVRNAGRVVHVSTDEVYGPIIEGYFGEHEKEDGDHQATTAYAKSKSIADDLARSYRDRLDVRVVRPTNAFGPWQHPEKAIPRWIARALEGLDVPVWGDGMYVRQWVYAPEVARAVWLVLTKGQPGQTYNIGPSHESETSNLSLARWIAENVGLPRDKVVLTEYDRPNHDRRYAVENSAIRGLGWDPGVVWDQLEETIAWYREHKPWWSTHLAEAESIYADI